MNEKEIADAIEGKTILITGGTGSFGNAVLEKLLRLDPKEIVIFSRDEKKQFDMANKFLDKRVRFLIGDVRDERRVAHIMPGIDLVFHAAALKQVPNCEYFPMEAMLTNVVGAHNVISAAIHHGVERVVILSTDKAVYPINAMGMTKALMERVMIASSREKRSRTILCGTRYGNVMYTRGSVIPYFVDLMAAKKPIRLTDKNMTRFMMSLPDSVDLVLYALANGKDGEMYVRKAPATTMGNLAEAMVSLFHYEHGIEEVGLRLGEKTHETLVSSEESARAEDCVKYYKIKPEMPGTDIRLGVVQKYDQQRIISTEGYTSANTRQLTVAETKNLLLTLPEIQVAIGNV